MPPNLPHLPNAASLIKNYLYATLRASLILYVQKRVYVQSQIIANLYIIAQSKGKVAYV